MLLRSSVSRMATSSANSSAAAAGFASLAINHDAGKRKFFITLPTTTSEALLEYDIAPATSGGAKEILDVLHTFSPPEARGQGLAARLADAAFKYAREKGMVVRPSCSYISGNYLKKGEGEASKWTMDASLDVAVPKIE